VLCAWSPPSADAALILNNYSDATTIRVGRPTRFTYRPNHEWYCVPPSEADEVSMLKCLTL